MPRLAISIAGKVILSLIITAAIYLLLTGVEVTALDKLSKSKDYFDETIKETISELQTYVTENKFSLADARLLYEWDKTNKLIDFRLISGDRMIYETSQFRNSYYSTKLNAYYFTDSFPKSGKIEFSDGSAAVYVSPLMYQKLEWKLDIVVLAVSFAVFMLCTFYIIGNLVKDIMSLKNGVMLFESGCLDHHITVKQKYELSELCESLNRLAAEIDKRNHREREQQEQASGMVMTLSHDLRTPLTSIIGYTELLRLPGISEDKRREYIDGLGEKAELIQRLAERLFKNSVTGTVDYEYDLTDVEVQSWLQDEFGKVAGVLAPQGVPVLVSSLPSSGAEVRIDLIQMSRVFSNIEDNIIKYADRSGSVSLSASIINNILTVIQENKMFPGDTTPGIGLHNSMEILRKMNGSLSIEAADGLYRLILRLPIL